MRWIAHDGVVVEIAAGVLAVGADAADDGRQVDDDVGAFGVEQIPARPGDGEGFVLATRAGR